MLEGVAKFEGETHPVFSRIAAIGRTLYLDLGGESWEAVAITAEGWQVVGHPPARFRRSASIQALPHPEKHPDGVNRLRDFVNVGSRPRVVSSATPYFPFQLLPGCFHLVGAQTQQAALGRLVVQCGGV
ncbi:hypothetical protein [Shimia sp. R9_3]|uniref:hypothetical protein n=1 Tax=Shimia sp. R9_3 TaxID=2821113 RepID=UPI001AD9C2F3|nr:hypothetical protein [Shimia sp. R9_3]MBO9403226.1 hypothetical protein [Shimia sp. R9_3]